MRALQVSVRIPIWVCWTGFRHPWGPALGVNTVRQRVSWERGEVAGR